MEEGGVVVRRRDTGLHTVKETVFILQRSRATISRVDLRELLSFVRQRTKINTVTTLVWKPRSK